MQTEAAPARAPHADRFYGKYRGIVSDNADPLNEGRLRALVPDVLADVNTGWALPCAPFTGVGSGLYAVPAQGAGVWIEFEAGDVSRPIWSGGWWAQGEIPKGTQDAATTPGRKLLRSETGMLVALDDAAQTITISDKDARNLVTIKVADGTIEIRAGDTVTLEAPSIKHGRNASQHAVLGDELQSWLSGLVTTFNSHTHPGSSGGPPALPAFPPSGLLSSKNTVE